MDGWREGVQAGVGDTADWRVAWVAGWEERESLSTWCYAG